MIHIVGGGIHGCFFAIALQSELGIPHSHIRIYDPHPFLMYNWIRRTRACSMQYLRSNSSQSIHVDMNALRNFARASGIDPWNSDHFALPYHRPSIALFNEYARHCLKKYRLPTLHVRHKIEKLLPEGGMIAEGRKISGIVIYTGARETLRLPPEARKADNIVHVFSKEFYRIMDDIPSNPIIVGGGISALQLTLALAKQKKQPSLITRRPMEIFRFDFNPQYIGSIGMSELDTLEKSKNGMQLRMEKILANRFTGTIPPELANEFQKLCAEKAAHHAIVPNENTRLELMKSAKIALFCGGFAKAEKNSAPDPILERPGQTFVHGHPILKKDLQWGNGIFISGKNAMYRIGPAAPNIIGAHLAWRIIRRQFCKMREC
ncbi:MAG: hypothetical protein ACR2PY_01860 [Salinispira sp.]